MVKKETEQQGMHMYGGGFTYRHGSRRRRSFITPTTVLVAATVLVYIYTSVLSGNFIEMDKKLVLPQYGQFNQAVFAGQYWQLVTSIFVHVDITHILMNMLFLVIFGLRAEELFSTEEYFAVYLFSGLSGSLLTLFLMESSTVSAGASGAIFGLYGAGSIYMRKAFGQSIVVALIYSFLLLMLSSGGEDVNNFAHFGGLAVGLIMGYVLAKSRKPMVWMGEL